MAQKQRIPLVDRISDAAETILAAQKYVSPVDVLVRLGWLDPTALERWRRGQIDTLESAVQTKPARTREAMNLFRAWAAGKGLSPAETPCIASAPRRQTPRFTESGDPSIELLYRTHFVSPELPEKTRERIVEKTSRAPELVVIQPLTTAWTCHRCGGTGNHLMMETPGPACLRCAGLDDLEFLPAGDALVSRRAKAKSARWAVVVRFSRSRRRYERQGLLVEPRVLEEVQRSR